MLAYLKFAPYAVIAILVMAVLWFRTGLIEARSEAEAANKRVAVLETAVEESNKTIDRITKLRENEDKLLAQIGGQIADLNKSATAQTQTLNELAVSNETVKNYLGAIIPDDLKRLLDNP